MIMDVIDVVNRLKELGSISSLFLLTRQRLKVCMRLSLTRNLSIHLVATAIMMQ